MYKNTDNFVNRKQKIRKLNEAKSIKKIKKIRTGIGRRRIRSNRTIEGKIKKTKETPNVEETASLLPPRALLARTLSRRQLQCRVPSAIFRWP